MSCSSCGRAADPGDRFCASCGASLEQRCATCGTLLPADARFCPSCGTSVATSTAPAEGLGPSDEERKVVSVLFADLVGFTASSDGADPEDVRRRVQPFHSIIREVVEGYGGKIEKLMGDGVLAVFGVPTVHEDDAERAVRAALQIQDRIRESSEGRSMQARVAIGTGAAVVRTEGATADREGILGDVVNTASRLQGEAQPGSVLVDDATHRATRRAFTYEERPPVAVKGKSEPLAVWVPISPVARLGADLDDDGAEFVGRTSELSLLVDAFTRALEDGTSQIVTIAGEPGVGKSRLVRELRRHINDLPDLIRWRQGRCLPYGEGITYWALGEVVKAEAGILETDTPATAVGKLAASLEPLLTDPDERVWVAGRLSHLVGAEQEVAIDRAERFAAWHRYLAAFGEQRPTVVVIEDLHWADANLVEFLADVPEATRGTSLLLVCTARPDFFEEHPTWGGGQRNAVTIRLDPLDGDATAELLDLLLAGEDLDAETRQMVLDRSGGNPLWAQEFVRMLHDRTADSPALAIPDTVQAVVASRIDLLDTDTKTVIQAASTVGKSFWKGAVEGLLDDVGDLEASLRELSRRELVRRERMSTVAGETEYAFTHSVVRDVAYGQAPRAIRAERHHRTARWIEGIAGERLGDRAEVIAHHDSEALRLATATDLPDVTRFVGAAVGSHLRAGTQARFLDAMAARAHYEAALELVPDGDRRRPSILYSLADVYGDLGMSDAGRKLLLEARVGLDELGDVEQWGEATALLSTHLWVVGEPTEAAQVLRDGIERLERHVPGRALATLYSQEAGRLWLRGDAVEQALEFIQRVRPIVEVHGDLTARRRIISAEGGVRFDVGDPSAVELFRQVLRMSLEADESFPIGSAYLNLGEQLRTGWPIDEAISVHERGLEVAIQRRVGGAEQFLRTSLAVDYWWTGRWDDALAQLDAGLALPERFPYMDSGFRGLKLLILSCRGQAGSDARERMAAIVEETRGFQDLQALVPALEWMTWVQLMEGDVAAAASSAREVVELSGATRYLVDAFGIVTWVLSRTDDLGVVEALLPNLERFDMPRPRAQLRAARALLDATSDPAVGLDGLVAAGADLENLGLVLEAVLARSSAVRLARALGDEARADEIGRQARDLLAGTGAEPLMERLGI